MAHAAGDQQEPTGTTAGDRFSGSDGPPGSAKGPGLAELARLVGSTIERVTTTVEDVHRAVLTRTAPADPTGVTTRAHSGIASVVYSSVRNGGHMVADAIAEGLERGSAQADMPSLPGRVSSALNAAIGAYLEQEHPGLAITMTLLAGSEAAGGAPPADRLVIFVHGLAEDDRTWRWRSQARWGMQASTYGSRLAGAGWDARYAKYNTGRHVSDNGADLDRAIEQLVTTWPLPLTRVALVGHSMGGLVARSALHQAAEAGRSWAALCDTVVALGTPHLGSDLERGVHVASRALRTFPELEPFADLLNDRSAGIKDLRYGYTQRAEWHGRDPDAFMSDGRQDLPPLPGVRYYTVSAVIGRRGGMADRLFGDGLVRDSSASGAGDRGRRVSSDDHVALEGLHHMDLLNHPEVDIVLRRWLA